MKKFILLIIGMLITGGFFWGLQGSDAVNQDEVIHLNPVATVKLGNGQTFKIELYPDEAPNTVNNFIALVDSSYYNDLTFSKMIPDYMVQTGDRIGNGTGFPGYYIKSECKGNGYENNIPLEAGTVCMSRGQKYNTEGSQFFILLSSRKDLEGKYTAFGKVIEGLEYLREISHMTSDSFLQKQKGIEISHIQVNTFGKPYQEPQVLSLAEVRELP